MARKEQKRATGRQVFFLMAILLASMLLVIYASFPKIQCNEYTDVMEICIYRPWHSMILESDPVMVSIIIDKDADTVKQLASNFNVTSSTDPNKKGEPLLHFPMIVRERAGGGITTYFGFLEQGRWIIDINIENQTSHEVLYRAGTTIFVQPVQDFYNAIIAVGTIVAGIGGPAVAVFALRAQRKQAAETLAEMKSQRESSLESMAADRKISEDSLNISKETMRQQLRPWIGRYDIIYDGAHITDGSYVNAKQDPKLLEETRPVEKHIFKFMFQNYGNLPALHCSMGYSKAITNDPDITPNKSALDHVKLYQDVAVMPGEQLPMDLEITPEERRHRLFVAGKAKYSYLGGEGFYDFIMEYDGIKWTPHYNQAG